MKPKLATKPTRRTLFSPTPVPAKATAQQAALVCTCRKTRNKDCMIHGWIARYREYQLQLHRQNQSCLNFSDWAKQEGLD